MNYVIVGNGPAGTSAVEALREVDGKGKITLISEEGIVNYSKPLITYLLGKKVRKDQIALRQENFYTHNHVQLILKKKAQKLDVAKKEVTLNQREKVPFDKLLIATGGLPISLPIEGRDSYGVFTFTTLQDAEELSRFIRTTGVESAVVIGGGLIGLKAT
jgi:NAD(P)H-nitrite reductase large subunit